MFANVRYTCSLSLRPGAPQKSGGLHTAKYIVSFLWRQTEQCLVWNVFKDKANFAGCEWTGQGGGVVFGEHAEASCIG